MDKIQRIAIVGTHSTGKSTLIKDLQGKVFTESGDVLFIKQVNRLCGQYGLKINEEANDLTQLYIAANDLKQIIEAPKNQDVISDRCILDTLIYTHSMVNRGQVKRSTLDSILEVFLNSIDQYTDIVWLRPEFDIVEDGVRSTNPEWRNEIDSLFQFYINAISNQNIKIHTLSGKRHERVYDFLQKIWKN